MKKTILTALMLAFAACGFAQTAVEQAAPGGERTEWLPSLTAVAVNAPLDIRFVKVPTTQAPRITYDTKGSYTTKFKAEVKDKVLVITERADSRRPERTTVVVEYNDLESIKLENCVATFDSPLTGVMLDLTVGGVAVVTAVLDVQDVQMEATGKSSVSLSGTARYLSLYASTGKVNALELEVMAAQVNVTSSSSVSLWVTDRLDVKTSTGGKLTYKGAPGIVRGGSKFMGGEITPIQ